MLNHNSKAFPEEILQRVKKQWKREMVSKMDFRSMLPQRDLSSYLIVPGPSIAQYRCSDIEWHAQFGLERSCDST